MSKRVSLCLIVLLLVVAPSLPAAAEGKKPFQFDFVQEPPPPPSEEPELVSAFFSRLAAAIRTAIAERGF